jgi:hypothetical protein
MDDIAGTLIAAAVPLLFVLAFVLGPRLASTGRGRRLILGRLPADAFDGIDTAPLAHFATADPGMPAELGQPTTAILETMLETDRPHALLAGDPADTFYELGLLVTPPGGGTPYRAEVISTVPAVLMGALQPGAQLDVLADPAQPELVFPNWVPLLERHAVVTAPGGAGGPISSVTVVGNRTVRSAFTLSAVRRASPSGILAGPGVLSGLAGSRMAAMKSGPPTLFITGLRGMAVVKSAEPLGKLGDVDQAADPATQNELAWRFTTEIVLPERLPMTATFVHPVPAEKASRIFPGVQLAVAVDYARPPRECVIDWDGSPLP